MRRLVSVLAVLAVAACATAPIAHQFNRTAVVPASDFDTVWNRLIDLFGQEGWAIANMEKASGLITTDWMSVSDSHYLDCGSPGLSTDTQPEGKFNVVVRRADNGVSVTVNTFWRTYRSFGHNGEWVNCVSTGAIEREIDKRLEESPETR